MSDRALVIVPTYNERENIKRLVDTVLVQDARIDILIEEYPFHAASRCFRRSLSARRSRPIIRSRGMWG